VHGKSQLELGVLGLVVDPEPKEGSAVS
jgi:hypothetical protein